MNCQFEQVDEEYAKCSTCGVIKKIPNGYTADKIHRRCDKSTDRPRSIPFTVHHKEHKMPSLLERGRSYLEERKHWKEKGKPVRSPERIIEIYNTFCDKCEGREQYKYCCSYCGCFINKGNGSIVPNKIAWATTYCGLKNAGLEPLWGPEPEYIDAPPPKKGGCGCPGH